MEVNKKAIAKNKLLLLYLLDKMGMRLSEAQLMEITNQEELMDYFDLHAGLAELTSNHLLEQSKAVNGTFYEITDIGRSTLEFFQKEVPYSKRQKLAEYADLHRDALRLESQLFAEYLRIGDHQYRVTLKILENDVSVFELSFFAFTKEEADKFVKSWRKNAMEVYRKTFDNLLQG